MTTYHKRPTIGPVGDDDEDFQLPHTTVVPLTFSTTPETTYSATIEFVSDGEPEA